MQGQEEKQSLDVDYLTAGTDRLIDDLQKATPITSIHQVRSDHLDAYVAALTVTQEMFKLAISTVHRVRVIQGILGHCGSFEDCPDPNCIMARAQIAKNCQVLYGKDQE